MSNLWAGKRIRLQKQLQLPLKWTYTTAYWRCKHCKGRHSVYYVAHHVETGDTSLNRCACNILIALKSSKDHRRISKIGIYKIFMQGPCARSSRSSYTTSPGSPQDLLLRTYARLRKWMPEQQDLLKILRSTKYCACHKTWIRCKPGPTFCASLRSRNAHGHLRRARLCDTMKMLQTKIGAHTLREPAQFKCTWTSQKGNFMWEFTMKMWQTKSLRTPRRRLCASLRIRNAHRHLTRDTFRKNARAQMEHPWSNTGL